MIHSKHQPELINHSASPQLTHIQELLLWEQYSQQLSSIAGTLSDSYWVSQGLSMLKYQDEESIQSKTKQALGLLNGHNSKIELINKILNNLSLCSSIEANQQKLVKQVIILTNEWEKWKQMKVSQMNFQDSLFGKGHNKIHQNDEFPENMQIFEKDFDERILKEFAQGQLLDEKDVEI